MFNNFLSATPYSFLGNIDLDKRRSGMPDPTSMYAREEFDKIATFPYDTWTWQLSKYYKYWAMYNGAVWDEPLPTQEDARQEPIPRWPLKLNPYKRICMTRAYMLVGEVDDTALLPISAHITPKRSTKKVATDVDVENDPKYAQAIEVEEFLNDVWVENAGRALLQEAMLVQQAMGGIILRIGWEPGNIDLENEIKIELVLPEFFMPVFNAGQPDDLLEAFVVYRIEASEARHRFGFESKGSVGPLYIEHWTKESVTITLDGEPIVVDAGGQRIVYNKLPNPWGFVPFVYVPTERSGSFYGISALDGIESLVQEINARWADLGDTVEEIAHRELVASNIGKTITTRKVGTMRAVIDLGPTLTNSNDPPELKPIDPPNLPDALVDLPDELHKLLSRETFLPPVTTGEDEGSQRSALTLAFRMWPLVGKVRAMRSFWTSAMRRVNRMIVNIAIIKKIGGMTRDHLKGLSWDTRWAPILPKDNEQLLNTVILLMQTQALAPIDALRILGIVPDPEAAIGRVKEWLEFQSELSLKQQKAEAKIKMTQATVNTNTKMK